jgi:hypothetical protein
MFEAKTGPNRPTTGKDVPKTQKNEMKTRIGKKILLAGAEAM